MNGSMDSLNLFLPEITKRGDLIEKEIINLRRHLHQNPEVGHEEFKTTAYLKKQINKLGLQITDDYAPTGFWATLETGRPGPVIAVRTDIDALPISEQTGLPFASCRPGYMHACGHDVHMAIMVGTTKLLTGMKKNLKGTIKFLFQPAEEVPPGGAIEMIKAGVLKSPKVDAIVALHVDPELPCGTIGRSNGVSMAAVYDFDLIVHGRSGHAAMPHKGVDAIAISAQIITGLQQVVSRMIDPVQPAVITFGTITGGMVRNAIADRVQLSGTARSLDPAVSKKLPRLIKKVATDIGKSFGAKVEVITNANYPPLINDERVNQFITDSFKKLYPRRKLFRLPPVMGGEDFACYLKETKGAMFRLGVGNKAIGADKPWHHVAFKVDEKGIKTGYSTMTATVINLLLNWR